METIVPGEPITKEAQQQEETSYNVYFAGITSTVESTVRDAADSTLTENTPGFWARLFRYNLLREYYRHESISKARRKVTQDNIFGAEGELSEDEQRSHHQAETQAIAQRLEYATKLKEGHTESAQRNTNITQQTKDLINKFATGTISEKDLGERVRGLKQDIQRELMPTERAIADNMLAVAKRAKQALENGEEITQILSEIKIFIGNTPETIHTNPQLNTLDKLIEKAQRSYIGRFVNETTIASAISLTYSILRSVSTETLQSYAFRFGSFGLSAGVSSVVAGLRENTFLKNERSQNTRDKIQGRANIGETPRRDELDQTIYESESATDITQRLDALTTIIKSGSATTDQIDSLRVLLGEIKERSRLGITRRIDLISYSSPLTKEREQTNLMKARAEATVAVRSVTQETSQDVIDQRVNEIIQDILEDIEEKDQLFSQIKSNKVSKAVLRGLISGIIVGATIQEIGTLFNHTEGVIKGIINRERIEGNNPTYTPVQYLIRYLSGRLPSQQNGHFHTEIFGTNKISLPDYMKIVRNGNHGEVFIGGKNIGEVTFNSNNTLTPQSIAMLHTHGVNVSLTDHTTTSTIREKVSGAQPTATHASQEATSNTPLPGTIRIHRTWFNDNSPKKSILNELKLDYGGVNGSGIDANGNIQFYVGGMTDKGSFVGTQYTAVHSMIEKGQISIFISATKGTQNDVFKLAVNSNGYVTIPKGSEVSTLFSVVNGHAQFNGAYVEVGGVQGTLQDGSVNTDIFATIAGSGQFTPHVVIAPPAPTYREVTEQTTNYSTSIADRLGQRVVFPPFIPAIDRTPLEKNGLPLEQSEPDTSNTPPEPTGIGTTEQSITDQGDTELTRDIPGEPSNPTPKPEVVGTGTPSTKQEGTEDRPKILPVITETWSFKKDSPSSVKSLIESVETTLGRSLSEEEKMHLRGIIGNQSQLPTVDELIRELNDKQKQSNIGEELNQPKRESTETPSPEQGKIQDGSGTSPVIATTGLSQEFSAPGQIETLIARVEATLRRPLNEGERHELKAEITDTLSSQSQLPTVDKLIAGLQRRQERRQQLSQSQHMGLHR
jgi:hypothetical protein